MTGTTVLYCALSCRFLDPNTKRFKRKLIYYDTDRQIWFLGKRFLVHLTVSTFVLDFKPLQTNFTFLENCRKRQALGALRLSSVDYWIDHQWYDGNYRLRVSRGDVRRMGKHSHCFLRSHQECMALFIPSRVSPTPFIFGEIHRHEN